MVKQLRAYYTNQPYVEFGVYDVDGIVVHVKFGGMRQTWDCQPIRADTEVNKVEGEPSPSKERKEYLLSRIREAFPGLPN